MDFDGFPTFYEESATKIVVTLVSGGVERATGYQDLQKRHIGNARSHQNDARGTLDAPLRISSFFSLVFLGFSYLGFRWISLDLGKFFPPNLGYFRKKSEGDRKKKVFSEKKHFSSIICIRAPARRIRWSCDIGLQGRHNIIWHFC